MRVLRWVLLILAILWLPAVIIRHGADEISAHLAMGFTVFIFFSLIAMPVFGLVKSLMALERYITGHPQMRRLERMRNGLCVDCGYDLRGNVSGVCPECGTPITSRA